MEENYVVLDMEMTGLSSAKDKIIEIGAVKVTNGKVTENYSKLINPNVFIKERIVEITGITQNMVKNSPNIGEVLQDFMHFLDGRIIIGHNIMFDFSFLIQALYDAGFKEYVKKKWYGIDTLRIARVNLPKDKSKRLEDLCLMYGIYDESHHRALNDASITNELYKRLCRDYEKNGKLYKPVELSYKPCKEKKATAKQIERVTKLLKYHNLKSEYDLEKMSQSEISRYADKIVLEHGRIKIF